MKHDTGGEIFFTMTSFNPQEEGVRLDVTFYEEGGEPRFEAAVIYRAEAGDFRQGVFRMSPRDARSLAGMLSDAVDRFEAGDFPI